MNSHDNDDAIRSALAELRDADEAHAPDFNAVLDRQPAARVWDMNRAAGMLAAAGILIALSVAAREGLRPRLVVPAEVAALSSWQPMTDALLEGLPDVIGDTPLTASLLPMARFETTMEKMP